MHVASWHEVTPPFCIEVVVPHQTASKCPSIEAPSRTYVAISVNVDSPYTVTRPIVHLAFKILLTLEKDCYAKWEAQSKQHC
jgi:hypothetical protein